MKSTVLITGASQGIGYELAKLFARDGYDLLLVARNDALLKTMQEEFIQDYEVRVEYILSDLSIEGQPQKVFEWAKSKTEFVEILVNNAGFGLNGLFIETDLQTEQQMIQLNISALTQLTKLFLGEMKEHNQGKIMNVASTAAFIPGPFMAVYYATKAYVLSFSQALSNELRDTAITVTALCPGATATNFAETAKMKESNLFSSTMMHVMSAEEVAKIGYVDLFNRKAVSITGLFNKLLIHSTRFTPRKLVIAITRWIMDKRN